ncbi:MAG: DUF6364 family protein [Ignavibacteria bacterium]|jgi:replicative DNA helicase|nr:DUF6364 family protein [Ignavibacteria bacterium]
MATKLTLTIDKEIIKKAKNFAQEKNKSVSRIVEEYLNNISSGNTPKEFTNTLNAPITDSLIGMFSDTGKDYKDLLNETRTERFL